MMPALTYLRPSTLADAVNALQREPAARLLAGGQSLVAAMKLGLATPSHLVDLQYINELSEIRVESDHLWIGAMVTHHQVATSNVVHQHLPMLSALASGIADQQVRNRGTIGGSVAFHDPSACWPTGVLACDATIVTQRREIRVDDFFAGLYSTALNPDEIILGFKFDPSWRGVYLKSEQKASRFALVGVAVAVSGAGMQARVRVAITGLGHGVTRWFEAESVLSGDLQSGPQSSKQPSPEALLPIHLSPSEATSDLHASAAYRAHLAKVLCVRAVARIGEVKAPAVPPGVSSLNALAGQTPSVGAPDGMAVDDTSAQGAMPTKDKIRGSQHIPIGIDQVWAAIQDTDVLRRAIPGCESIRRVDDGEAAGGSEVNAQQAQTPAPTHLEATIKVGLGFISARFVTQICMHDQQPPSGTSRKQASLRMTLSGQAGALGSGQGEARVQLEGNAESTKLEWLVTPQVQGSLAQLGSRMMEATAKKLSNEFFARLTQVMGGGTEAGLQDTSRTGHARRGSFISWVLTPIRSIWHWLTGK